MTSTDLFPATDLILGEAPGVMPTAVVGASDAGIRGGYITGADALVWYPAALAADDLVLAVWPSPELPVVLYGGDPATLDTRLRHGTVVLVAGGHSSLDVGAVVHARVDTPAAAVELFGFDGIATSGEEPLTAAIRRFGDPGTGAELFALNGATVTVRVPDHGSIAEELAGRFGFAVSRVPAQPTAGPTLLARLAWTRSLGAFQMIDDPDATTAGRSLLASDEPTAVIVPRDDAEAATAALLDGGGRPDIVLSGGPGGPRTTFDDLTLAFGGDGAVVLTGHAVPPHDTVVVRGDAAAALSVVAERDTDGFSGEAELSPQVTLGPAPAEDRDRWLAHNWARSQRVWAGEPGAGGADLAAEAIAIGAVPITDADLEPHQPTGVVARIAAARDWHPIDPELHAALAPIADAVHDQAAGADRDLSAAELATLSQCAADSGLWARLPAAYHQPDVVGPAAFEFPFPAPTVELLRAAVAADGNAAELRRLIGPIKVALRQGFRGRRPRPEQEGDR